jgi:hypothetical protein
VAGALTLFVVGLAGGGSVAWIRHDRSEAAEQPSATSGATLGSTPSASPGEPPTGPSSTIVRSPSPTPSASPKPSPPSKAQRERQAYADLLQLAAKDLRRTKFSGEWVAQLSSKYVGVKDPRQRTASGSHRFGAVDILAEHRALRDRFDGTYRVRLLRGQDWGAHTTRPDGATFWYTLVIGRFDSRADVNAFCRRAFPDMSGKDLENQCVPRTLRR